MIGYLWHKRSRGFVGIPNVVGVLGCMHVRINLHQRRRFFFVTRSIIIP
uniref:Uncharacterized protein n=1 Tax=Anguilla anguilla TaxID=7936 RepID=A0A0E9Q0Q4_ANGAN